VGDGLTSKVDDAYEWLLEVLNCGNDGKDVDIVGFSRGAAAAMHFANRVVDGRFDREHSGRIRFIGLWDTVPSIGFMHGDGGLNIDLPPGPERSRIFHAMSIDEDREDFTLRRIVGAHEVWFAGAHSDVGGGYSVLERGLSNAAFRWMVFHARQLKVPLAPVPMRDYTTFKYINNDFRRNGNVVVHDEIESNWIMGLTQDRVPRQIKKGDQIHISAGMAYYDPFIIREQQSEGFAAKLKSIIRHRFPGTKINTDDGLGWITQPFDYRQYNDTI